MSLSNKRKSYLVNPQLQFKLLRLIVISMLLPAIVIVGSTFYFLLVVLRKYVLTEVIVKTTIILGLCLFIVAIFVLTWGLVFSNRIAGPLYRLERELDKIREGNLSRRLKFRKHDEFHFLAEAINKLLDVVEKRLGIDKR
jgi:signal transduction histidine kinase